MRAYCDQQRVKVMADVELLELLRKGKARDSLLQLSSQYWPQTTSFAENDFARRYLSRQTLLNLFAHLSYSGLGNGQRVLLPILAIEQFQRQRTTESNMPQVLE